MDNDDFADDISGRVNNYAWWAQFLFLLLACVMATAFGVAAAIVIWG